VKLVTGTEFGLPRTSKEKENLNILDLIFTRLYFTYQQQIYTTALGACLKGQ